MLRYVTLWYVTLRYAYAYATYFGQLLKVLVGESGRAVRGNF